MYIYRLLFIWLVRFKQTKKKEIYVNKTKCTETIRKWNLKVRKIKISYENIKRDRHLLSTWNVLQFEDPLINPKP